MTTNEVESGSPGRRNLDGIAMENFRTSPQRSVVANLDLRLSCPLFTLPSARFVRTGVTGAGALEIRIGGLAGQLSLSTLIDSLERSDFAMDVGVLRRVVEFLPGLEVAWPGEAIPAELLDGSGGWRVEPRHRLIARQRLALRLFTWAGENGRLPVMPPAGLDDAEFEAHLRRVLVNAAQDLAVPEARLPRFLEGFERLAHEHGYIESLRGRFGRILALIKTLQHLSDVYRDDYSLVGELFRILALTQRPLAMLGGLFGELDPDGVDIPTVLTQPEAGSLAVRSRRDRVRAQLLDWQDILALWHDVPVSRRPETEVAIRLTYRFVLRNFFESKIWRRG
ncbi:MAG: hypothetical protein GC191_08610 [Azospirillum sp.]|nr:hypothetical protein [Azospirillum sp.]